MSKRLLTLFLACLIVVGAVVSVINFTSDDAGAYAEYGSWVELYVAGVLVFEDCMGTPSNCCIIYPDKD